MSEPTIRMTESTLRELIHDLLESHRRGILEEAKHAAKMEIYTWATSEVESTLRERIRKRLNQIAHSVKIQWEV